MRLQSAIFDMDGTLVDSMPMWRSRAESLVRSHGAVPPPDLNSRVNSLSVLEGADLCKELCGLPGTPEELAAEVWGQIEQFYRRDVRPKPGLVPFLSILKMEGVWMYVATATDRPPGGGGSENRGHRRLLPGNHHHPGGGPGEAGGAGDL